LTVILDDSETVGMLNSLLLVLLLLWGFFLEISSFHPSHFPQCWNIMLQFQLINPSVDQLNTLDTWIHVKLIIYYFIYWMFVYYSTLYNASVSIVVRNH
jgi:hypothetical protein